MSPATPAAIWPLAPTQPVRNTTARRSVAPRQLKTFAPVFTLTDAWLWIGFGVVVAGLLGFDLGVLGRHGRRLEFRWAVLLSGAYIALGLLFGLLVLVVDGVNAGMEYYTAYLLEESLSLDNIFLWLLIFEHLKVPEEAQHRVLFWGIIGAIALRGVFIFAGTALIELFHWVLYLFGILLIVSGVRLLRSALHRDEDVGGSRILRFLRRHLRVTEHYEGRRFLVRHDGLLHATPLLLALLVIEVSDLVFALDSIPAIFGVTQNRLVIYTSNVFAIIGLRSLYFVIAGAVEHLRYIRRGLSLLLILIGLKMIAGGFIEIPIWVTLGVTVVVIGGTVGLSLLRRGAPREQGA